MIVSLCFALGANAQQLVTAWHDAAFQAESSPDGQNVWGREDRASGCNGDGAYALVEGKQTLTTGVFLGDYKFSNETLLKTSSQIVKVELRIMAYSDEDRRNGGSVYHIGLASVVLRSGGRDIASRSFNGVPRARSTSKPVAVDVTIENANSSPLFTGADVLSTTFGVVSFWSSDEPVIPYYIYVDCTLLRLTVAPDVTAAAPSPTPVVSTVRTTTGTTRIDSPSPTPMPDPLLPVITAAPTPVMLAFVQTTTTSETVSLFFHEPNAASGLDWMVIVYAAVPAAICIIICIAIAVAVACKRSSRSDSGANISVSNSAFGTKSDSDRDKPAVESPPPPVLSQRDRAVTAQALPTSAVEMSVRRAGTVASLTGQSATMASVMNQPPASPRSAASQPVFLERGYAMPYSFESTQNFNYAGERGFVTSAVVKPVAGEEATAHGGIDRKIREQYGSAAKQNQILDDLF